MHRFPVTAAVSEMLPLLQQRLHQRTANAGVAVSVDSVGEPSARHADLLAVLPLDHAVVSVAPFLHCQHRFLVSTDVLAEEWCEAVGRLSVIRLLLIGAPLRRTRGQARTFRYVWTNPLQRSASVDGGQKNTAPAKQGVLADAASGVCVSVAPR